MPQHDMPAREIPQKAYQQYIVLLHAEDLFIKQNRCHHVKKLNIWVAKLFYQTPPIVGFLLSLCVSLSVWLCAR